MNWRSKMTWMVVVVAGLMLLATGKAQAVTGVPDDVPGSTLLYPFFKVDPTPDAVSRQDSLIVVTNTANPPAAFSTAGLPSSTPHTFVHITIWSVRSQHVYDFTVQLTPHDVFSCSLLDLLVNPGALAKPCGVFQAPTGVIDQLRPPGATDLLAGYVTADVVAAPTSLFPGEAGYPFRRWNILIGHLYLVDLPAGSATGFNAVSLESINTELGHVAVDEESVFTQTTTGFYLNRCLESQGGGAATPCAPFGSYGLIERIDGPTGNLAQNDSGSGVGTVTASGTNTLGLLFRYFSATALNARSEIWLWKDRNTGGTAAAVTVAVYDEDENAHSITFSLPDEVSFAQTAAIITPGAPGGWFRLKFPCGPFGFCGYNPNFPAGDATQVPPAVAWVGSGGFATPIQAVAYSLQFANSQAANLRWDAAFPAHRQYEDYIGGAGAE